MDADGLRVLILGLPEMSRSGRSTTTFCEHFSLNPGHRRLRRG
jgi:hypothetical protein